MPEGSGGDAGEMDVDTRVFGPWTFSATVGMWLAEGRKEAATLLSPFISTEGFAFTPTEYVDLRERLQVAIRRYERLPRVSGGLEDLNTGFFRHRSLEDSREFIDNALSVYLDRGDVLHRDYLLAIHRHDRAALFHRRRNLRQREEDLARLASATVAAEALSGRPARKARQELDQAFTAYNATHGLSSTNNESDLTERLAAERRELAELRRHLHRELKADGLALNALTVNAAFGVADDLTALEARLKDLVAEVDEAGLYQLPLGGTEAATTPRQLRRLESLLAKLRNTRHHLAELPVFHDRRAFWYAQPAHLRRLLAPLLDLPTTEWETAFTSWYFEHCLESAGNSSAFFTDPEQLTIYAEEQSATIVSTARIANLHYLTADEGWPTDATAADLFVFAETGQTPPAGTTAAVLRLAPPHDTTAAHCALAGVMDTRLIFLQHFHPLTPPNWRDCLVDVPPAGSDGRPSFQLDGSDWQPLTDYAGGVGETLHLYLPAGFTPEDEAALLQSWEQLIVAAPACRFFHNWSGDAVTRALLSDGFNARFLTAALLRAAEAAATEPFERESLVAIGREIRLRCGLTDPGPHPLAEQFAELLRERLPDHFFELHQPWRDTFLPLVVLSPAGRKTVLLPDGRLPGVADDRTEAFRQRQLRSAGFRTLAVNAGEVWADWRSALEETVGKLQQGS